MHVCVWTHWIHNSFRFWTVFVFMNCCLASSHQKILFWHSAVLKDLKLRWIFLSVCVCVYNVYFRYFRFWYTDNTSSHIFIYPHRHSTIVKLFWWSLTWCSLVLFCWFHRFLSFRKWCNPSTNATNEVYTSSPAEPMISL